MIESDVPTTRSLPTAPADRAVAPLAAAPQPAPPLVAVGGPLGADPGFAAGSAEAAVGGAGGGGATDSGPAVGVAVDREPGAERSGASAVLPAAAVPALAALLARYGLAVAAVAPGAPIPGSYWGDAEAGLIGTRLYLRDDTPLHSALHEAGHFVCMDAARRAGLHTNAGGDYAEECGVCLLQVLLADALPGVGRARMCADMDAWGYSFRLGSTAAWLAADADDARDWLRRHGLIDAAGWPTFRLRQ